MTREEFEYLCTKEAEEAVEQNLTLDPSKAALSGVGATVAAQIKYLQRAKAKIPNFYKARCIIPALQYEQCSSLATAKAKNFSGELCIDLTCGLGVDSSHFASQFNRVISIEKDELLCKIAKHNFKKLSLSNIEIVNNSAVNFLSTYEGSKASMVYVDPARRDEKRKVFLLEECSPNMLDVMDLAMKITDKVVVKLSPLFDIEMVFRLFSKWGSVTSQVVSLGGECKEVIAIIEREERPSKNEVVVCNGSKIERFSFSQTLAPLHNSPTKAAEDYKLIYLADVAFYKSRRVGNLFAERYKIEDFYFESDNSPIFSNQNIEDFCGTKYSIVLSMEYKPKVVKKWLKANGNRVTILKKNFDISTSQLRKELNINDGSNNTLLFTTFNGKRMVFVVQTNK